MLNGEKCSGEIGTENSVPVIKRCQVDWSAAAVSGIGHNHGELSGGVCCSTCFSHALFARDIAGNSQNLSSAFSN